MRKLFKGIGITLERRYALDILRPDDQRNNGLVQEAAWPKQAAK